jgi:hypothetical protein
VDTRDSSAPRAPRTTRKHRPDVSSECIHCLGSGWILDPSEAEDDEDRTFPCHMCRDDTLDAQHSCLERMDD